MAGPLRHTDTVARHCGIQESRGVVRGWREGVAVGGGHVK